jgi:NUMOD3 motif
MLSVSDPSSSDCSKHRTIPSRRIPFHVMNTLVNTDISISTRTQRSIPNKMTQTQLQLKLKLQSQRHRRKDHSSTSTLTSRTLLCRQPFSFFSVLTAFSILSTLISNRTVAFQGFLTDNFSYRRSSSRLWDSETTTEHVMHPFATTTNDVSTSSLSSADIPLPTVNGGFSHTNSSKAKISAANKGKIPWNKGKERSPQVKALIASGVRANNRLRFLEKLEQMGLTEEEFAQQKKDQQQIKDASIDERRTEKGGYRPTEETRKKISDILKAKWANGEMSPRKEADPSKSRRGFTHTEETRAKISDSLKKKWAGDPEYRENQITKTTTINSTQDTRKKISDTLKIKWQDPDFRDKMMDKMKNRKKPDTDVRDDSYRKKISEAMKARWQDPEYRNKAVSAIRQRSQTAAKHRDPATVKRSPSKKRVPKEVTAEGAFLVTPIQVKQKLKRVVKQVATTTRGDQRPDVKKTRKVNKINLDGDQSDAIVVKSAKKEPDGSINRLREERRDLFDLLYGEEEDTESEMAIHGAPNSKFDLEDGDLDAFDPYGLDDH